MMAVEISPNTSQLRTSISNDMPSPSRTTLESILSGESPKPYTFNAFLDFLHQNHCEETLNFISEAKAYPGVYGTHWSSPDNSIVIQDPIIVGKQWTSLMGTYILPGSPSEINLPGYIRESLLGILDVTILPPHPDQLDSALDHAYEILTHDALIPFIRSFSLGDDRPLDSESHSNTTTYYGGFVHTFSRRYSSPSRNKSPSPTESSTKSTQEIQPPRGFRVPPSLYNFSWVKYVGGFGYSRGQNP
ncbi:hexose transporter protein [Penicillium atrosanguineum]|uniref:hexose transporter protein n=1 Tax=Penicillium atrosanguineum TaxID=1132637 RepID=UPI002386BF19|nr:hexose transporter protein [Penicillium atrosanguineum]KAJ5300432.1 hexose transporter protein [Penicillium atrosanguineum]